MRAVSLFSNCGAGDIGFRRAGFRFDVLAEIDARRLAVAQLNHPEATAVPGDLRTTWRLVVKRYRELAGDDRPALLSACPPCQGMSSVRHDRGPEQDADAGARDERNLLVVPIAKVAKALRPRVIVVENVPAFLTKLVRDPATGKSISAARLLIAALNRDYEVFPILCDLADYGVPQTRKRAFLTFLRRDEKGGSPMLAHGWSPYPRPSHCGRRVHMTVSNALSRAALPRLDARRSASASDSFRPLHFVPVWDLRRYTMVAEIPRNTGRSAWENSRCPNCAKRVDCANAARCPACKSVLLRPIVRRPNGTVRLINGFRTSSYRRMHPDRPSPTITTASGNLGSAYTIHPSENRVLSPLECGILQTFPASFRWGKTLQQFGGGIVRDMIGEAVPPLFTEKHGKMLVKVLSKTTIQVALSTGDKRCSRAVQLLSKKPRLTGRE